MAKKSLKTMARKGLATFLALVMMTSLLQIGALASEKGTEGNPWLIGDMVKGDETEPAGHKVDHSKWVSDSVEAVYETEASCEIDEHAHGAECYEQSCEFEQEHTHTAIGEADGCRELTCEAEEHSHGNDCDYTCGREEHRNHNFRCGGERNCRYGGTHTHSSECCGKGEHTHGDDCYAVCEIEEHTHTEQDAADGCYKLICEIEPHAHSVENGCFAVVEEAYTQWTLVAETYSAAITVQLNNSSVSNASVELIDAEGNTVASGTTQRQGNSRYAVLTEIPAGTYTVSATYTNNGNTYKGTAELTVSGPDAEVTVTLKQAWGDIEAKVYYLYANRVPGNINKAYAEGEFGPSGDNKPAVVLTIDMDQLLAETGMTLWSPSNSSHVYLSVDNSTNDVFTDDDAGVEALWQHMVNAMDPEDKAALDNKLGEDNFIGYVLKQEGDGWHLDGILAEDPPVYVAELYHNNAFVKSESKGEATNANQAIHYQTPHEANDPTIKSMVEEYLGAGGTWTRSEGSNFDNIYTFENALGQTWQATVATMDRTSVQNDGDLINYRAVTEGVYYVARFNITELKDLTVYQNYTVVANYYSDGVLDNETPVELETVQNVASVPGTESVENKHSAANTQYNGKTYTYTSIEQDGNTFILRYDYTTPYVPTHALGSITVTKSTSGAETPATALFQLQKQEGDLWSDIGEPVPYGAFTDGSYTFDDLAEGTYRIQETGAALENYDLDANDQQTVALEKLPVGDKGDTQVSDSTIAITNTYTEHTGSLQITKTASGADTPADAQFVISGPNGYSKTVTYGEFENGVYTISGLKLGEYTVTENAASAQVSGYHLAAPEAVVAAVTKDGTAKADLNNVYTELPPTSVSGAFSISFDKAVSGDEYTMSGREFAFQLTDGTGTYTGYNDANGKVTIEVPFDADLAGETGSNAGKTLTFTLSEVAGSVEGMTYDSAQYDISVVIGFSRKNALDAWKWSIVSASSELDEAVSTGSITLSSKDGAVFTNEYDAPVYTGSITLIKKIEGELTQEERAALAEKLSFAVNKAYATVGGGNAYIQYASMTDGQWVMDAEQPGVYTITEHNADVAGYKLTTEWKVEGASNDATASAKFNLAAGDEVTVTVTNTYAAIPTYQYKVVHEYFQSKNGGGYESVGTNAGTIHTVAEGEGTPVEVDVFNAQVVSETYNGVSYSRLDEYAEGEVIREGSLKGNTLVFTVKYYGTNWTEGSLTIRKNVEGLDKVTLTELKNALTFIVTGENGFEQEISYKDFDNNSTYTLTGLTPGTYTVAESGAEIEDSGYELSVSASDDDDAKPGYQVEVEAGKTAAVFTITNHYTGRIYNIWFDGGNHGTVRMAGGYTEGLWRNSWQRFQQDKDTVFYDWGGSHLAPGQTVYQSGDGTIYKNLVEDPEIEAGTAQILYTFSWDQWADYRKSMGIFAPGLDIDEGYTSDKEFYIPGTDIRFTNIADAMAYMNSGAVQPDANGIYNVLYVARYEKKAPEKQYGSIALSKFFTMDYAETSAPSGFEGSFLLQKLSGGSWTTVQTIAWSDFVSGSYATTVETGTYRIVEVDGDIIGYDWSWKVSYADESGESFDSVIVDANEMVEVVVENDYTMTYTPGPEDPIDPVDPVDPVDPIGPIDPVDPVDPVDPIDPVDPVDPIDPVDPVDPVTPDPGEEVIDIPEEEVPLAELPDEETPLADVPKTGSAMMFYAALSALSGMGLVGLSIRKRKEDEEA